MTGGAGRRGPVFGESGWARGEGRANKLKRTLKAQDLVWMHQVWGAQRIPGRRVPKEGLRAGGDSSRGVHLSGISKEQQNADRLGTADEGAGSVAENLEIWSPGGSAGWRCHFRNREARRQAGLRES